MAAKTSRTIAIKKSGDSSIGPLTMGLNSNFTTILADNYLAFRRINSGMRFNGLTIGYIDCLAHEGLSGYTWGGRWIFMSDGIGGAYYKDNPATRSELQLTARGSETGPTTKHAWGAEGWYRMGPSTGQVRLTPSSDGSQLSVDKETGLVYSPTLVKAQINCGAISLAGVAIFQPWTTGTKPSASANVGVIRITNSTPANRLAYSNGTNWYYVSDDALVP